MAMTTLKLIGNPNINLWAGIFFLPLLFQELLTTKDELKLKSENYKPLIIKYLVEKKETTTSQLSKVIGLSYEDTFYILKELEREHKIVVS